MKIISVIQRIVGINTTRHKTFNLAFDTMSFILNKQSSITFPLFLINSSMKILQKKVFPKKILGEAMRKVSGLAVIPVGIYPFKSNITRKSTRERFKICSKLTMRRQ